MGKDALLRNTITIYMSGEIVVKSDRSWRAPVDGMSRTGARAVYALRNHYIPGGSSDRDEAIPAAGLRGLPGSFLPF